MGNRSCEESSSVPVFLSFSDLSSVTTVLADYNCMNASAGVSWGTVYGATSYRATAVDQNGRTVSCTSTGTTCQLVRLGCGSYYVVRVSAISNNCESTSTVTDFFQTGEWASEIRVVQFDCIAVRMVVFLSLLIKISVCKLRSPMNKLCSLSSDAYWSLIYYVRDVWWILEMCLRWLDRTHLIPSQPSSFCEHHTRTIPDCITGAIT